MLPLELRFSLAQFLIGLIFGLIIALLARQLGALSDNGTIAAILLGGLTFGIGRLPAAILLIAFFASSSLLTKLFSRNKLPVAKMFSKGGRRDWAQVLANGGAALIALMVAALDWLPAPLAWAAYAGALATVTADTWATELGVLSHVMPFLITTWEKVPKGTSGGISVRGSLAAFMGALLIAALAVWIIVGLPLLAFLILVTFAGFAGSYFDSLLGATVQAIYYCPQCKKETERYPLHTCGAKTKLHRGWAWLDNDWVNFISSVFGALVAVMTIYFWL